MNNDYELIKYKPLPINAMNKRANKLEEFWKLFLEQENESNTKYYVHLQNLFEVIRRQDERMYYYKIFHDLECPCEYKYVAIECFWINTLKPFMVIDDKSKIYSCPNEMFSLFLIVSTIASVFEKIYPDKTFPELSIERMRDILYDFKYCSLSREAMISFVETFADTYGVGIDFLQKNKEKLKKFYSNSDILSLWK